MKSGGGAGDTEAAARKTAAAISNLLHSMIFSSNIKAFV